MKYYVYVFLDPRKPGNYQYGEYKFDYEPYYVGKGKNRRYRNHFTKGSLNSCKNSYKRNKINKLVSLGFNPINYIQFPYKNETEEKAFSIESLLIKLIGRFDLNLGPLTNLTDGGEGVSGCPSKNKGKTLEEIFGNKGAKRLRMERSERMRRKDSPAHTKEAIEKSSITNSLKIKQLDLDGNLIKVWDKVKDAAKSLGICKSSIHNCVGDKYISSLTAGGFKWEYECRPNKKYYLGLYRLKNTNYYKMINLSTGQTIYSASLSSFCRERGLNHSNLYKVCNGKYKESEGWKAERISKEQYINMQNALDN